MSWVWGLLLLIAKVLLGVLLFAVLLMFLFPIRIELHYKREGKDDRLHVGIRALFGLIKFGYDVPIVAFMERKGAIAINKDPAKQMPSGKKGWVTLTVEKIEKIFRDIERIKKRIGKYKRAIRRLTKAYHIESLKWRTTFGTGDAAQTAYISGVVWGLKGLIAAFTYSYFTVDKRLLYDVKPHFQAKGFRTEFSCIIRFWLGKAMVAGLTLAILWLREGMKWRTIRSKA